MLRSIRVGRILGAEIKLHWSLPLLALAPFVLSPARSIADAGRGLGFVALLLLSVLLHELGHTLAARACGIPVRSIVLWPLGGLAMLGREPTRLGHQLAIIAAGPAANLGVVALILAAGQLAGRAPLAPLRSLDDGSPLGLLWLAGGALLIINLVLGTLNLLPVYPLDGGRIAHALLERVAGTAWANRVMLIVSIPLAAAFVLYTLARGSWLDLPLGLLLLLGAAMLHPAARQWITLGYLWLTDRPAYYVQRGDLDRALSLVNRRIARRPDDAQAYATRGWIAYARKDAPAMLGATAQIVALQPDSPANLTSHGYAAHLAGDDERALASLDRALALDPGYAQAHNIRGLIALGQNDLPAALAAFEASLRGQRTRAELALAHNNRGYLRLLTGDEAGAADDIERALAAAPELHYGYLSRGELRLRRGELDAALADFDHAVRLHPAEVEGYLFRSQLAAMRGDSPRASVEMERAVAAHGEQALVRQEYWLAAWVSGQLPWALEVYGRLIERGLQLAAAYQGRADALRVNGRAAEAIADYTQALMLEPARAAAYLGRARARLALGEPAAADIERALGLAPTANLRREAELLRERLAVELPAPLAEG